MKKILLILAFTALIPFAFSIDFPIAKLGNCSSQKSCEAYCDQPENIEACIAYAGEYGLMTKDELNTAVKMLVYIKNRETPGKCSNEKECNDYCDKEENLNECIDFALKIGEITPQDAEMGRKTRGKGPGGCKRKECNNYCNDESHLNECIDFALANGLMDAKEAEMVKKTGGKGPGNCKGKPECDAYCQNPAHSEECFDFSVQYGLIDAKDAEMTKACMKGPESCNSYCYSNDERFKQCIVMWESQSNNNRPSKEDLTRMKIQYYDSPGNCRQDKQCMNQYCSQENEAILFECENFKVKLGEITQAEYEQWKIEFEKMKKESEAKDLAEKQLGEQSAVNSEEKARQAAEFCSKPENLFECWRQDFESGRITAENYEQLKVQYEINKAESERKALEAENLRIAQQSQPAPQTESAPASTGATPATQPEAQAPAPAPEAPTGQVTASDKSLLDIILEFFLGKK